MKTFIQNLPWIVLALLAGFSAAAGWLLWDLKKKVKILWGEGEAKDGEEFLKNMARRVSLLEQKVSDIKPRLEIAEEISQISVQKVGFLRFNPFRDTGGDQSFIIVLLDRRNNGVLLSSLYTRDGIRLYAKNVEKGKSKHPLSAEEEKVLAQTLKENTL